MSAKPAESQAADDVAVSVILPAFGRDELACRAIESVLGQQAGSNGEALPRYELVIVDDGTPSGLPACRELLSNYARTKEDRTKGSGPFRVQQIRFPENRGVAAARNAAAECSEGRYLAFLDSDDSWEPRKLSHHYSFMCEQGLRISQTQEIWFRGRKRVNPKVKHRQAEGRVFERCLELCCISPSATMIDRKLFFSAGAFDERMRVCEDYDLWLRVALEEKVGLLREPLVLRYGGRADQLSASEPAMDRYRCFSMCKLLLQNERGDVASNEHQVSLVRKALASKLKVLSLGASKRGNAEASSLIRQLTGLFCSGASQVSGLDAGENPVLQLLDSERFTAADSSRERSSRREQQPQRQEQQCAE